MEENKTTIYILLALLIGWIIGHFMTSKMMSSSEDKCNCGCDGSCSLPSSSQMFDEDMTDF